ncbi:hypothetical protein PQX77_022129 [Marasmius sp. AFHP31]|nr:hypothetical protein PQX77_022129 [Marasmius sp. AFHP31]
MGGHKLRPKPKSIPAFIPKSDCPDVPIYFKKQWDDYRSNGDTNGLNKSKPRKPGRPSKDDPATPYPFLLLFSGQPADSSLLDKLHDRTKACCNALKGSSYAPTSWGQACQITSDYVYAELLNDSTFSKIFLAADGLWKVQAFVTEYYRTWTKHHLDKDSGLLRPKRQRTKSMARPNSPEPPTFPFNDPNLIKMDIDPEFTQVAVPPQSPMDVDDGAKTSPLPSTSHRDAEPPLPLTTTPAPILNHLPLNHSSPSPSPPLSQLLGYRCIRVDGISTQDNGTALPSPGPPPGPPTPPGTSTAIESPEEHSAGLLSAAVPSNSPQVPSSIYDPFEVRESEGLTTISNPPDQQLERVDPTVTVVAKVSPAIQAAGSSTRAGGRRAMNRAQVGPQKTVSVGGRRMDQYNLRRTL